MRKALLVMSLLGFFAAGYLTGSIQTKNSLALELGGLGQTVDSLKSLGKTVVEMQDNVNKLQANINEVKKVREDIASYQGIYNKVIGTEPKKQVPQQQQDVVTPELQKGLDQLLTPKQKQQTK